MSWLLLISISCAVLGVVVANSKGRGGDGFVLGCLFGPLGVIVAALLGPTKKVREKEMREKVALEKKVRRDLEREEKLARIRADRDR